MELEVDPRLEALPFKVRACSRESVSQKAGFVLDSDLRTYWSTGTNAKEWIVFELEESCLLSHIRVHNKSVLEWEIAVGLKFKPESFLKVRPRCEAPRRDMTYYTGYVPCRFIRISCLRGNPIAIFYVQLMGIPVPGLEPEFQPVVEYLLPRITSPKEEFHTLYLKLLQDITSRLSSFLPQLEGELSVTNDMMDSSVKLLAMLVGPFYPIVASIAMRDSEKVPSDESSRTQASLLSVSSNFQAPPKRGRNFGFSQKPVGLILAHRLDNVLLLFKVALKDPALSAICRKVAGIYYKLAGPLSEEADGITNPDGELSNTTLGADYSDILGDEYRIVDDISDFGSTGALEVSLIEEGLLHVLYGLASQPALCKRLADSKADLVPVLPFIQAVVPALRPTSSGLTGGEIIDESFRIWQAPQIQRAVAHVVALATSPAYRPLLDACSEYLASFSAAHEKAACILIDLCTGPLSPWLSIVTPKVDLAIELIEDLIGVIQAGYKAVSRARAALIYLILGLGGYMDEILGYYKDVKHNILFLIEMLEPFLLPAILSTEAAVGFSDISTTLSEKHDKVFFLALDFIFCAVKRPTVLPALEAEWRGGHISSSILLSILAPQLPLPPGVDACRYDSTGEFRFGKVDDAETMDDVEQSYFAPPQLKEVLLSTERHKKQVEACGFGSLDEDHSFDLQADCSKLVNAAERELRASEFIRFAVELHSQTEASGASRQAAVDSLLLAAECHLNPLSLDFHSEHGRMLSKVVEGREHAGNLQKYPAEMVSQLEEERDKTVLRILLQAAKWELESLGQNYSCEELEGLAIDAEDLVQEDAATIVRQHQSLLFGFFMTQLRREMHNMYNVLLQGFLFVLEVSTGSISPPEDVVEVILQSAQRLNRSLISEYNCVKEGYASRSVTTEYGLRRQWNLLYRIVHVVAGGYFRKEVNSPLRELIPVSAWLDAIPKFATSTYPLVRYIGWMTLPIYSRAYRDNGLLLISNIQDVTKILLIFSDELTSLEDVHHSEKPPAAALDKLDNFEKQELVDVLYPELHAFFPKLSFQVRKCATTLLEAVCDQMRSISPTKVPDLLTWFTEVCSNPFPSHYKEDNRVAVKGVAAANVKRVILQLLEVIVVEHMEAIVPEMPRVIRMLLKICSSSYCDIPILESVLSALKPLITYATSAGASMVMNQVSESFSAMCFGALLDKLKEGAELKQPSGASVLFLCGYLLSDIPSGMRADLYSSLLTWVEFTKNAAPGFYCNYLQALEKILDSLRLVMESNLHDNEFSVYYGSLLSTKVQTGSSVSTTNEDVQATAEVVEIPDAIVEADNLSNEDDNLEEGSAQHFQENGQEEFQETVEPRSTCSSDLLDGNLQKFLYVLGSELEAAWKYNPKLVSKVGSLRSRCLLLVSYLRRSYIEQEYVLEELAGWDFSLLSLIRSVADLQKSHCWQVAALTMDFLLELPSSFRIQTVLPEVCSVLKYQSCHAPRLSWRLQTEKWFSRTLQYVGLDLTNPAVSSCITPLLGTMLEHPEPEQRSAALEQLNNLLKKNEQISDLNVQDASLRYSYDKFIRKLVAVTWDKVASSAVSDSIPTLRLQAMELLLKFVPLSQPDQLSSFLCSADALFPGTVHMMKSGPYTRLALALLARACIYASPEDAAGIPAKVWSAIEDHASVKPGSLFMEAEKHLCKSLLELRQHGAVAKQDLENALRGEVATRPYDPGFVAVRDSVLEVFARLSVLRERADSHVAVSKEAIEELDLEETKPDLEQHLHTTAKVEEGSGMGSRSVLTHFRDKNIIEEKAAARTNIAARRERQKMVQRDRQIILEEAAQREILTLQELDRERALEAEREIERQKVLERERAKTRELKHALDLEMERRAQRDYQRELEQRDGRPSRREYTTTTTSSRSRDRYREAGRESSGSRPPDRENAVTPPPTPPPPSNVTVSPNNLLAPTTQSPMIMTNSSRAYQGPGLNFQQGGGPYEDLLGGNGGISDYGDMDEGRHSRSARPRLLMERSTRERREGGSKWERKQT